MRKALCTFVLASVALGLGAQQTVKIGWIGPETGDSALWGQAEKNALLMLTADINAKGGLDIGGKKYKLQVVPYDDKGDSVEAVNVVKMSITVRASATRQRSPVWPQPSVPGP